MTDYCQCGGTFEKWDAEWFGVFKVTTWVCPDCDAEEQVETEYPNGANNSGQIVYF